MILGWVTQSQAPASKILPRLTSCHTKTKIIRPNPTKTLILIWRVATTFFCPKAVATLRFLSLSKNVRQKQTMANALIQ